MYQMSNGSRYSYFSIDESSNSIPINKKDETSNSYKTEIKDIEKKEKDLDHLQSYMNDYQRNTSYSNMTTVNQNSIIDQISSINSQQKELNERKRYLIDQISEQPTRKTKQDYLPYNSPNNSYFYDPPKNCDSFTTDKNCSSINSNLFKYNPSNIFSWSMDVYNYTISRTLDKNKYLSPGSLLRETRDSYGHYNYTYFNDQDPEQVEIFDYTVPAAAASAGKSAPVTCSSNQQHNISTFPSKPQPIDTSRTIYINDIINRSVDSRHVIILRGLPGSGKSTFCQAFKEKEIANNRSAPRILSLDHFFVEDNKFEYEPDLEPKYRHELFKLFKRQIDEGFFSVILVDCINEKVEQFAIFYQYAKMNRFQVSIMEVKVSPIICAKRSEDRFTPAQVYKMADDWEETPSAFDKLDATSFLQDSTIEDVEMEDITDEQPVVVLSDSESEEETITETGFFKSKWDEDFEDTKERLDGVKLTSYEQQQPVLSIKEYLKIEMENLNKLNIDEKSRGKHVKWADFEELKKQKRRKELGFVAGNTDWTKLMSSDIDVAEAALVQVKYFSKDGE